MMNDNLLELILKMNPWLNHGEIMPLGDSEYIPRLQTKMLLLPDWDEYWLILVGPRQAGKTTLGKYIAKTLIKQQRFTHLLYLNCDFLEVREWLHSPLFIDEAREQFKLDKIILFIDEAQRLENPGLLLKGIADLKLPIKMIASGSSQLEIKSNIQEYLTGRNIEALILPLSYQELQTFTPENLVYGCYPKVTLSQRKAMVLKHLYQNYIQKDIIEILKIGKPDLLQKLITLIAHSSGQLVNYTTLATDCKTSVATIQHYCSILEKTYTIYSLKPFVGNKRKEVVANPVYYFIDNGFRNQSLRKLTLSKERSDYGLLMENAIFQELLKFKEQHFYDFDIHYWRTQSGAEIDFVLYKNDEAFLPIEVKARKMIKPTVSRAFRSFVTAYQPRIGIIITDDYNDKMSIEHCQLYFVSFKQLLKIFGLITECLQLN